MNYALVDRFLELEKGRRARAVKCVTLGEPFVCGLDGFPPTLVLEALLQTGGVLARAGTGFRRRSVLGKIESAEFPSGARAGDRMLLDVDVLLSRPEGTLCEGVATVDGRVVGRARFLIVFVPPELEPVETSAMQEQRRNLMRAMNIAPEGS